jgi:hypothetical protein
LGTKSSNRTSFRFRLDSDGASDLTPSGFRFAFTPEPVNKNHANQWTAIGVYGQRAETSKTDVRRIHAAKHGIKRTLARARQPKKEGLLLTNSDANDAIWPQAETIPVS